MPIWLMILITVLGTLMIGARSTDFFYCKCKNAPIHSMTSSLFWHKENSKETRAMLPGSPQQSTGYPNIKATPEMVKEMSEVGAIHPSQSLWCNAVVLVHKNDGGLHFCHNCHKLDARTKKDSYPLP